MELSSTELATSKLSTTELSTTVVWGCTGMDTTQLSYRLALSEAEKGKTLLAELPCLGIPRLGFSADIMDRACNMEAFIMKLEQEKPLEWQWVHQVHSQLGVLPASVFATPDCPVVSKVSMRTLIKVATSLIEFAKQEKCRHLILDCQGQLTNPMTFFALKHAERVIIPISKPTDAAYVLANLRRLVQIYKHALSKYTLLVEGDIRAIKKIAIIKGEDGKPLEGLKIISWGRDALNELIKSEPKDIPSPVSDNEPAVNCEVIRFPLPVCETAVPHFQL
jgi:hypothetical protein